MEKYIPEESAFHCLLWLCHALNGIFVSMLVGENFFYMNYVSDAICRDCTMGPILIEAVSYQISNATFYPICFLVLSVQISVFVKKGQLESVRNEIISSSMSGECIELESKRNNKPYRILWRYQRSVVSPLGGFLSTIANVTHSLCLAYIYLNNGCSQMGSNLCKYLFFSIPSLHFFLLNLINTLFSPTLLNSFIDVATQSARDYHVINV